MANKSELKPLIKAAKAQGWTVEIRRGGHLCWKSPNGGTPYFSSSTPGDHRAVTNIRKHLQNLGLQIVTDKRAAAKA